MTASTPAQLGVGTARRNTKIIATLGPASATRELILALAEAGADVFRLNFSHGSHAEHQHRLAHVRAAEVLLNRPLAVMADLQGPKIRLGRFEQGQVTLAVGQRLFLDADPTPGNLERAPLPHPEVLAALTPGAPLLVDDGKMRFVVVECDESRVLVEALTAGTLSDRKGVSTPQTQLPMTALTDKDREDLAFALAIGVDWVALSFVQTADDVRDVKALVQGRAGVLAKIEKPLALRHLQGIVREADALMVARGDLGVELNPEEVPLAQRRIIRECRRVGRPVVVATQMLESMIHAPTPTRAEASDVAGAVYEAVDAVMLSAETAAGEYPVEAVVMMSRIVRSVEADPLQQETLAGAGLRALQAPRALVAADAIGAAVRSVAASVPLAAIVTYTSSGASALRVAQERAPSPLVGLTPHRSTARRLALVWGVQPRVAADAADIEQMVVIAQREVHALGLTKNALPMVVVAGLPFGQAGSTNLLRLVWPGVTTTPVVQVRRARYFEDAESPA
jgi:pyruvate kinase